MSSQRNILLALSWYLAEIHHGVARYAKEHGWSLQADMAYDSEIPWGWRGDGVITLLGVEPEEVEFIESLTCPAVDLALSRPEIKLPRVSVDSEAVAHMAAEHFIERGFNNFAYYGRYGLGVDLLRREHFRDCLGRRGVPCGILGWEKERGDRPDTWDARRKWIGERLRPLPKPLALFTSRDKDGAEAIDACVEAGIHVPEEVAVLGANNNELLCDFLPVPLSSIDVGWEQVGYEGASLLDRLMQGARKPGVPLLLPPRKLVVRRSSDILAVEDLDVAKALRFIWENYSDPNVGVPQVAAAVFMSRSRLDKAFRKHLGRNVGEEIRLLRLRHVKKLLLETKLSLEKIGQAAGFATQPHFYRTFKKAEGMTPRQYRLQDWGCRG